ncbi:MAG: radical SAM protein [Elusimicrobiota bacterium]
MTRGPGGLTPGYLDFGKAPLLTIWETTRSCALKCRHCRARAELGRDPRELNTEEGFSLIDQVASMGTPIMIFSGGDCLNRDDIEVLIRRAKDRGLRAGAIPAAADHVIRERIFSLKDSGLDQIAFSLDAPDAQAHDRFRGEPGSFARTMLGAALAKDAGIPLQINTCFAEWNFERLKEMAAVIDRLGAVFWEVFLLVSMGRGSEMRGISSGQCVELFESLYRFSRETKCVVKLTEAQHYRPFSIERGPGIAAAKPQSAKTRSGIGASSQAVNAGKGFVFIDRLGAICPSGFLPIEAGNMRRDKLEDVYRNSSLFQDLRDPAKLKGKCGRCRFSVICGGSRSRAYAATGDYLAPDPLCPRDPENGRWE